jgi:hypothetical protein
VEPLTQRPGSGFHAGGHTVFGVTRRFGMQLTEALQLLHRQVVAGEVQKRIQKQRSVAVGEHEAVAVRPLRWPDCDADDVADTAYHRLSPPLSRKSSMPRVRHGRRPILSASVGQEVSITPSFAGSAGHGSAPRSGLAAARLMSASFALVKAVWVTWFRPSLRVWVLEFNWIDDLSKCLAEAVSTGVKNDGRSGSMGPRLPDLPRIYDACTPRFDSASTWVAVIVKLVVA